MNNNIVFSKFNKPKCFCDDACLFILIDGNVKFVNIFCTFCSLKVNCLIFVFRADGKLQIKDRITSIAYSSGSISFFQRWSRKKFFTMFFI